LRLPPSAVVDRAQLTRLAALGAPQRHAHESGADYVARLKSSAWLRPTRRPGYLAFTYQPDRTLVAVPARSQKIVDEIACLI